MEGCVELLLSSVSNIRPAGEKRRKESVGGRSDLPGVVFLPFIWTGIGIQFQLSVLHLLKHTQKHTKTTRSGGKSKGCLKSTRDRPEAPVQLCGIVASGKGLHTDYNTHRHTKAWITQFEASHTLTFTHKCIQCVCIYIYGIYIYIYVVLIHSYPQMCITGA